MQQYPQDDRNYHIILIKNLTSLIMIFTCSINIKCHHSCTFYHSVNQPLYYKDTLKPISSSLTNCLPVLVPGSVLHPFPASMLLPILSSTIIVMLTDLNLLATHLYHVLWPCCNRFSIRALRQPSSNLLFFLHCSTVDEQIFAGIFFYNCLAIKMSPELKNKQLISWCT